MSKFNFGEALANTALPFVEVLAVDQLSQMFNRLHAKDPKAYEKYIPDLYEMVDKHLEELTGQSKSKVDDVVIRAFKNAIEQSADSNGLELVNADND